ncbi:MAG: hypothetical protein DHS20C11_22620 [Lysobacteraceae bacterium]|nr:MAG: hypothetical protein DHS20C11_22620 [Xanthomonadaceae bacterium]
MVRGYIGPPDQFYETHLYSLVSGVAVSLFDQAQAYCARKDASHRDAKKRMNVYARTQAVIGSNVRFSSPPAFG